MRDALYNSFKAVKGRRTPAKAFKRALDAEEGKGKRKERVPEPDPRSNRREDSRRNRVKGKRVRSF